MTSPFEAPAVSAITSAAILPLAAKEAAAGSETSTARKHAREVARRSTYPTEAGGGKVRGALRLAGVTAFLRRGFSRLGGKLALHPGAPRRRGGWGCSRRPGGGFLPPSGAGAGREWSTASPS